MSIEIRPAQPIDGEGMWDMVKELAEYERAPNEVITTPETFSRDLQEGHYHAFVAVDKDKIVGMALFYPIYSTWKGLSYYLEDIVINENYRRQGIGSALFDEVIKFCKEHNAGRLGWQVLQWNNPAIEFYKRYGAEFDEEWITCRIRQEQIQLFDK